MNAPSQNNDKRIAIIVAVLFHVVIIGFFWLSANSTTPTPQVAKEQLPAIKEPAPKKKKAPESPTQEKTTNTSTPTISKESLHRIDKAKQLLK